jgi:hypothetical protein
VAFARSEGGGELGVTDIRVQQHAGADRVTFDLNGAEGTAGWHARYVDQAIEHGSGRTIDVDGTAIIEVVLTGMGLPFELDEDLWDDDRIVIGGEGIVEIVNRHVYEGRHQFFVGTTGLHPFVIDRTPMVRSGSTSRSITRGDTVAVPVRDPLRRTSAATLVS